MGRQAKLIAYLAQAARRPFVEGEHDCALFAAGAVAAQTGQDYAAPFRGRYSTTRGGLRVLRKAGFANHIALAAHHLRTLEPEARPRPGDLAVIPTEDGPALGVVQGAQTYVLGPSGLQLVPTCTAIRYFEV